MADKLYSYTPINPLDKSIDWQQSCEGQSDSRCRVIPECPNRDYEGYFRVAQIAIGQKNPNSWEDYSDNDQGPIRAPAQNAQDTYHFATLPELKQQMAGEEMRYYYSGLCQRDGLPYAIGERAKHPASYPTPRIEFRERLPFPPTPLFSATKEAATTLFVWLIGYTDFDREVRVMGKDFAVQDNPQTATEDESQNVYGATWDKAKFHQVIKRLELLQAVIESKESGDTAQLAKLNPYGLPTDITSGELSGIVETFKEMQDHELLMTWFRGRNLAIGAVLAAIAFVFLGRWFGGHGGGGIGPQQMQEILTAVASSTAQTTAAAVVEALTAVLVRPQPNVAPETGDGEAPEEEGTQEFRQLTLDLLTTLIAIFSDSGDPELLPFAFELQDLADRFLEQDPWPIPGFGGNRVSVPEIYPGPSLERVGDWLVEHAPSSETVRDVGIIGLLGLGLYGLYLAVPTPEKAVVWPVLAIGALGGAAAYSGDGKSADNAL